MSSTLRWKKLRNIMHRVYCLLKLSDVALKTCIYCRGRCQHVKRVIQLLKKCLHQFTWAIQVIQVIEVVKRHSLLPSAADQHPTAMSCGREKRQDCTMSLWRWWCWAMCRIKREFVSEFSSANQLWVWYWSYLWSGRGSNTRPNS